MMHLVYDRGTKQHGIYEDDAGFVLRWLRDNKMVPALTKHGRAPKPKEVIKNPDFKHVSILPDGDETWQLIEEGTI